MKSTSIDDLACCAYPRPRQPSRLSTSRWRSPSSKVLSSLEKLSGSSTFYCAATQNQNQVRKSIALTIDFTFYYIYVLYIRLHIYITLHSTDSSPFFFLSFIINRASIPLHRRMHEYISVGGLLACTHTVSQFRSKWAISLSAFEMSR